MRIMVNFPGMGSLSGPGNSWEASSLYRGLDMEVSGFWSRINDHIVRVHLICFMSPNFNFNPTQKVGTRR